MIQFVIIFTLLGVVKAKPIYVYGKPAYVMGDHDKCHEAANRVVQTAFRLAKKKHLLMKATTYCHEVEKWEA